jgi:protein-L-isoaspartate(D-aspartate) O-methyltransferase
MGTSMRPLLALAIVAASSSAAFADRPAPERKAERDAMVERQIASRGVKNARVLAAMRKVERHRFIPPDGQNDAYADHPVPIGDGQTISQPYIVALMTELLDLDRGHTVLEIGTGSGYQAAVLAEIVKHVYTIEIVPSLAARSKETLAKLGYENITVIAGDGYRGLPDRAPFDRIIVTAAPDEIPKPLLEQLAVGGKMVIPVGETFQELRVIEKTDKGLREHKAGAVRFVPMTGEAQKKN